VKGTDWPRFWYSLGYEKAHEIVSGSEQQHADELGTLDSVGPRDGSKREGAAQIQKCRGGPAVQD
jgi:hypothetical protein